MKRAQIILMTVMILLSGSSGFAVTAADATHDDSRATFDGYPWYAEGVTRGGVISDYGSHYGIKANVTEPRFCYSMLYSCLTSITNGQLDRMLFSLKDASGAPMAANERKISFDLWGWKETDDFGNGLKGSAEAFFIDTDVLCVKGSLYNGGSGASSFVPGIRFEGGNISKSEGASSGAAPQSVFSYAYKTGYGAMIIRVEQFALNMGATGILNVIANTTTCSAVIPSFTADSIANENTYQSYTHEIIGKEVSLASGHKWEFSFFVIFGDSIESVDSRAESFAGDGSRANDWKTLRDESWNAFFEKLPKPHTSNPEYIDTFRMSAAALRMNLYAPKNKMEYYCSVPSKPAFNFFWCWDTPFHATGQTEWDPWLAEQNFLTQFSGQSETGMVYIMLDDSLNPYLNVLYSQPPVHGTAILKVYETDPDKGRARAFLEKMYDASAKYLQWWENERDVDGDGLCEFRSGSETGWDDTPRYDVWGGNVSWGDVPMPAIINSVDLNSWLYLYYRSMEKMCIEIGKAEDAKNWHGKMEKIGALIDSLLWSEKDGCWYDLKKSSPLDAGAHIEIATPAIWMPALAGATKNETRIRRVVEEHILNPSEFFGEYPIPSVAYNSPYYDKAGDGCYWQGQIWLILAYTAVETLYKYGYEQEAEDVADRLVSMMSGKGGIYENYNAETGAIGWGFGGPGSPSAFQFGWSATYAMEMMLERHQRTRFVMPDETQISGYVKTATALDRGNEIYSVETGEYEVPRVAANSMDGKPIAQSSKIRVTFTDEYNALNGGKFNATVKGITFDAQTGKTYEIDVSKGSVSEIVPGKPGKRFISGFEILFLMGVFSAIILLKRKR
ncbi:MAG: hypothetical protein CVT48_02060 [Thermoplasmata archaeon HGW-Thermoplasmata-1]|nr:MAG: hypothetical protein CVT48_02060 [Thermoplasmata archaeon HGW-Thermoplasmata-1]